MHIKYGLQSTGYRSHENVILPRCSRVRDIVWLHHLDFNNRLKKKLHRNCTRMLRILLVKFWNTTPQNCCYTATYLLSHKPSKLDEQDKQDIAASYANGLPRMNTQVLGLTSKNLYSSPLCVPWMLSKESARSNGLGGLGGIESEVLVLFANSTNNSKSMVRICDRLFVWIRSILFIFLEFRAIITKKKQYW